MAPPRRTMWLSVRKFRLTDLARQSGFPPFYIVGMRREVRNLDKDEPAAEKPFFTGQAVASYRTARVRLYIMKGELDGPLSPWVVKRRHSNVRCPKPGFGLVSNLRRVCFKKETAPEDAASRPPAPDGQALL